MNELDQDQLIDDMDTETTEEPSEDEDTYHEFDRVVRIASVAKVFSWISLGVCLLLIALDVFLVSSAVSGAAALPPYDPSYIVARTWNAIATSAIPILFSGFFFVLLQAVSEGIYILLDIEDNTRRTASPADKSPE